MEGRKKNGRKRENNQKNKNLEAEREKAGKGKQEKKCNDKGSEIGGWGRNNEGSKRFYKGKLKGESRNTNGVEDKREIVVAKLTGWKEKSEVMTKKRNLKTGVYIEDDPTKKERETQSRLRQIVREKRKGGKQAIVRYM